MGQNAEVLGVFFPCDSFVALYELFELFLDEGKLNAIDFIKCQTTLTPTRIYQKCLFDDSRNDPSRYSHPLTGVR